MKATVVNGYMLQGRTIRQVRATTEQEMKNLAWDRPGVVLVLDSGTLVLVQQDEEGNGPGCLVTASLVNGETATGVMYVAGPEVGPAGG